MERVAVIGCGGSGKTTVSRELGRLLDLPVLHIDAYYRLRPGEAPDGDWEGIHRTLVSRERWIIDGMKLRVLAERLVRSDTVVYLDLPRWACFAGIAQRRLRFRGRSSPELGVYDRVDWAFLRWVWGFRRSQRTRILELLKGCDAQVVVLRSRRDVRRFLAEVEPRGTSAGRAADGAPLGTPS